MKNIFYIIAVFLVVNLKTYSQEIIPIENEFDTDDDRGYFKDVNGVLDKFTGEWEFTDATHYFKIKFYKIEYVNYPSWNGNYIFDELRSFMLYKELQGGNWVTIYNTYPASYSATDLANQNFNNFTSIRGNTTWHNDNKVTLFYYEPSPTCSRINEQELILIYSSSSGSPQLNWQLGSINGSSIVEPCSLETGNPIYQYKIPNQMTLNKL